MSNELRRSIDELILRYELEPTLRDIYVEGSDDQVLIKWFLDNTTNGKYAVYEIDNVTVPRELVDAHKMPVGSRGRLVVLAYELHTRLGERAVKCTRMVVDADFDHVLRVEHKCPVLLRTDFANMEMYLFAEGVFAKLVNVVLSGSKHSVATIMSQLEGVLTRAFLIRMANEELELKLTWLSCDRCCRLHDGEIIFDELNFLKRYTSNDKELEDKLVTRIEAKKSQLLEDSRMQMHGHDFLALMKWYLRPIVKDPRPTDVARVFEKTVLGCVEITELAKSALFEELLRFVAT